MDAHKQPQTDNACPSDEQLALLAGGNLPPGDIDQLVSHLDHCEACQAKFEKLDDVDHDSIDDLAKAGEPLAFIDESNCERAIEDLDQRSSAGSPVNLSGEVFSPGYTADAKQPVAPTIQRAGRYELIERLGEGAMGAVYRARHMDFGVDYAVKLIHPKRKDDSVSIERFQREMEAVGQLDHPNIVRAVDAGEEGDVPYLVMEFVDGVDLSRLTRTGPLGMAEACELIRQAAVALEHAHRHGRIHRDVKPSNLMLNREGTVKLLDLGLARLVGTVMEEEISEIDLDNLLDSGAAAENLTRTHQVMGTLGYMAPEQASDSRTADARADIYSLGCTLYKLLSGQPPFGEPKYSTAVRQILAHAQAPVPQIRESRPEIPETLAAVVERMLAKTPDERYATAAEVAEVLTPFGARRGLAATVPRRCRTGHAGYGRRT